MKKIDIDAGELCLALEGLQGYEFYLDRETGKVVMIDSSQLSGIDEDEDDDDEDDEIAAEQREFARMLEEEPDRLLSIPPNASKEAFQLMLDFVEQLPENATYSRIKADLAQSLAGRSAFSRFKEALRDYPEVREQWFAFRAVRQEESAARWLAEAEINFRFSGTHVEIGASRKDNDALTAINTTAKTPKAK